MYLYSKWEYFVYALKPKQESRRQLLLPMSYPQYYGIKLKTIKILYYIKLS